MWHLARFLLLFLEFRPQVYAAERSQPQSALRLKLAKAHPVYPPQCHRCLVGGAQIWSSIFKYQRLRRRRHL